jgi:hypothetical protein
VEVGEEEAVAEAVGEVEVEMINPRRVVSSSHGRAGKTE